MNSVNIKKWILYGVLLAVTLVLVWQVRDAGEQPGPVVAAKRSPVSTAGVVTNNMEPDAGNIEIKQRAVAASGVNLFDSPKKSQSQPQIVKPVAKPAAAKRVEVPFRYIGILEQQQQTTLFVMDGQALHLVREGDTVGKDFRLQSIDKKNRRLIWVYLPLNEKHNMSMEP